MEGDTGDISKEPEMTDFGAQASSSSFSLHIENGIQTPDTR